TDQSTPEADQTAAATAEVAQSTPEADQTAAATAEVAQSTPDMAQTAASETPNDMTSTQTPVPTAQPTTEVAVVASSRDNADDVPLNFAATQGNVCITLFQDSDQNARRSADEILLAGGRVQVNGDEHGPTTTEAPLCISGVPAQRVAVSVLPPDGFGLTTAPRLAVSVLPGRTTEVLFGAAEGVGLAPASAALAETVAAPVPPAIQPASRATSVDDDTLLETLFGYSAFVAVGLAVIVLGLGTIGVLWLRFVR
ncbi:MAG: hypothetical protein ACLFTK_12050, partial [Anaerolineales bacterium]